MRNPRPAGRQLPALLVFDSGFLKASRACRSELSRFASDLWCEQRSVQALGYLCGNDEMVVKARYNLVLQHLCDQRLGLVRTDSETAERERPIAILQHRFKLLQTFKVGPSPKQANWNFIAPLQTLVQGS